VGLNVPARIGIFGGAFDPPHNAHVELARIAIQQLGLDMLHIVPTGQAWHKARTLSPATDRLEMTQLAFADVERTVVDDREIHRPGPTYTIDTLIALQLDYSGAQLYLCMGADQFATFGQWHSWSDIVQIAIICIAARAQIYWADGQFDALKGLEGRVLRLQLPDTPVSATRVRQLAASGADVAALVPPAVARYIAIHALYRQP
jgi:nicotinate-nucleotide adenylyltransferase